MYILRMMRRTATFVVGGVRSDGGRGRVDLGVGEDRLIGLPVVGRPADSGVDFPSSLNQVAPAVSDARVVARYRAKVRVVPGSDCLWWVGAISAKGHGRFWLGADALGRDTAIISHRFGFALAYGPAAMAGAAVLAHSCDNPLCQNPDHLRAVSNAENKAQWAARQRRVCGVLRDMRGARGRSLAIREAIKSGGDLAAIDAAGVRPVDAGQLSMFPLD